MKDIAGLIAKAAEKTGFQRDFFNVDNIPTDAANITIAPFFGDIRSFFILSSLLLHRYKEQDRPSKYLIVCGWPGFSCLFPYVDEYWSIQSDAHIKKIYPAVNSFSNKSELISQYFRNLNQYFFEDVVALDTQFVTYYDKGITDAFWQKYKQVKRFLPTVPSSAILSKDFNREFMEKGGYKVFLYPSVYINNWHNNHCRLIQAPREFWVALIQRLLKEGFLPVICKSFGTYDLSAEFSRSCIYFSDYDMSKVLTVMRMTGCVLDLFSGISRLALAARTPFIYVDERARYVGLKEYEIDDLCGISIPKKYIFSFSTIIDGGTGASWDFDIFNSIIIRLQDFLPTVDKEKLPSTGQSLDNVPYDQVRNKKLKRIGTRLLKMPKDE